MAVMYSKLGGCLGVTAKLGPLARTDLWAGVKGLLERLMTHLGLGSSLEEPWGGLLGVVVGLSSQKMVLFWEDWCALCLGECLWPCLNDLVGLLNWPAWGELVAWGMLLPLLEGRRTVAWEELLPSPEGRWAIAWEELLPSPEGRWAAARRELLPSPGGRWAIAGVELGGMPDAWLLTGVEWLFTGVEFMVWAGLLTSLEGRRVPAWLLVWGVLLPSPGESASLPNWLGT